MDGILLDNNNDIAIVNGEMAIGDITQQAINNVLSAYPGEYKEYPLLGVGLERYINGCEDPFLKGQIMTQLESVGVKARKIMISSDGEIDIKV